ncbi:MAG: hypothetical protein C0597_11295 [Marinilabiliales bacterium]|nr:MAG: hypothetical protein C0597_11295 [Marinilabiliales bacterium]
MRLKKLVPLLIVFALSFQFALAQGGYEDLLYREVEVENPVYMPVIGIGTGLINYYGELKNDYDNILQGQPSYRFNVYQYLDNKHYWKANVNIIYGKLSGYERSYTDLTKNANFETEILTVGLNAEYSFGNIYKGERKIVPFISLGVEYLASFTAKTDIENEDGMLYQYLPDGTIRVGDEIVTRDNEFETNLKSVNPYGNDGYDASSYAAVLDAGFDFKISNRVALRIASSLHYTFTDDLYGISSKNTTGRIGDSSDDMFSFTYVSFNIDLFSSPKTITQELLFAEVEFDPVAYSDSDRDRILDLIDDCPDTPRGVPVDSVGCAKDGDNDGVPDYLDKEQFTDKGVIVDEFGAALSANKIREGLFQDLAAVDRDEVYMVPVGLGWSKYSEMTTVEIPEKYKKLDKDKDDYISFDELLDAINGFFDFDSEFTTEDIYDLNGFFFAQ